MTSSPLLTSDKGTYALVLQLESVKRIRVGQLGRFDFPRGYYIYVGSAFGPGGLNSRLIHHRRATVRPRWHIDYLKEVAVLKETWISEDQSKNEHDWAAIFFGFEGAAVPVPGFGSSDCTCSTHLFAFKKRPLLRQFQELVAKRLGRRQNIYRISF